VPTESNEDLAAIAQDEYNARPHYSYGFGYIQMQIYEQALREAGEVSQDALAEQFSSMTFDTVTGDLQFEDTNFADAPMFVTQVQDENIPVLWPDDLADTEPIAPLPDEWPDG
jgi:ABC-type branched-subunit amino acid transport system substrate-binding protein